MLQGGQITAGIRLTELPRLREQARRRWGAAYSHARFHQALLRLGSPPLGLMARALEDGGALQAPARMPP
jgi:uncharacterized protein (DUF885 family)